MPNFSKKSKKLTWCARGRRNAYCLLVPRPHLGAQHESGHFCRLCASGWVSAKSPRLFGDVVCPYFLLSSPFSATIHCPVEDGLLKSAWSCHVTVVAQFPFFDSGQEIVILVCMLPDDIYNFVIWYVFCVLDTTNFSVASNFHCLYTSFVSLQSTSTIRMHTKRWIGPVCR